MASWWQFLKENIVALLWTLALILTPIGSLYAAVFLGSQLRPSATWIVTIAVLGLALIVGGAWWFVREQLGHAESRREGMIAGLSRREAYRLRYIAKQFHSMGYQRELNASYWSAFPTIAEFLEGLADDRENTIDEWEEKGLRADWHRKLSILLGLFLVWIGTLAQGLAIWWGAFT